MKLPRFRFHLSTALLMTLVAGGVLSLSFQREFVHNDSISDYGVGWIERGWPLKTYRLEAWIYSRKFLSPDKVAAYKNVPGCTFYETDEGWVMSDETGKQIDGKKLLLNVLTMLGIAALSGCLFELFARWRARGFSMTNDK